MNVHYLTRTIEGKLRLFSFLSILTPLFGFFLIPILEASSSSPSYDGTLPGWQNSVIAFYAIFMVIIWIFTSIYYSKSEKQKMKNEKLTN